MSQAVFTFKTRRLPRGRGPALGGPTLDNTLSLSSHLASSQRSQQSVRAGPANSTMLVRFLQPHYSFFSQGAGGPKEPDLLRHSLPPKLYIRMGWERLRNVMLGANASFLSGRRLGLSGDSHVQPGIKSQRHQRNSSTYGPPWSGVHTTAVELGLLLQVTRSC